MAGSSKSGYGKEWKGPIRAWKGSDWGNEAMREFVVQPVLHAPTAILGNVEERSE